ncbi:MAG: hypothetical protein KA257_09270 [Opitutaceae bacterium]|nr:hypothetical protein [Opitutaceae bacterium]MBP9901167.1 hypothetical protein [Verrucomicrobiota bacterium]
MKLNPTVVARGLVKHWNYFSHHIIASPGMAHPMQACFEEAYVVMGAARTMPLLDDARMTTIGRAFNSRMMKFQGVHHPDMFDMGYGYEFDEKGLVNCSCVADNASTANGMLEVVRVFPHLPENPQVLASVKRYIDHCLKHYLTDKGVMGVGILNHKSNPEGMKEYWCADSLFAAVLINYADLSGETRYYDVAVPLIEYISTFDYKKTLWEEWTKAAPQQILLYTGEGLVAALKSKEMKRRLAVPLQNVIQFSPKAEPEKRVPAQAPNLVENELKSANTVAGHTIWDRLQSRWAEFGDWLHHNQMADGSFEHPANDHFRCYEPGLSWLLLEAAHGIDGCAWLESIAAKQLRFMAGDGGKLYYGLRANDFASGLALLSFATAGEMLKQRDPVAWEAAIQGVFDRGEEIW